MGTLFRRLVRSSALGTRTLFPAGHFYSPIVDPAELRTKEARLWPDRPTSLGIDFNDAYHRRVLEEFFPAYYGEFAYPLKADGNRAS
jgi:hypothetical protein